MFKNYLKIAFRNMQRQKAYSTINIFGLAIGLACCILMFLYVDDELSYDHFHKNNDRIVRIGYEGEFGRTARTPHILAPTLLQSCPEVENTVRIKALDRPVVLHGDEKFYEERFYYTDPSIFEVFSFPFIIGNSQKALSSPYSLVLTQETAQRYFGDRNPLGETLDVVGLGRFTITGIAENVPHNSHFRFNFLTSYQTLESQDISAFDSWDNFVTSTYVLLGKKSDLRNFEASLLSLMEKHRSAEGSQNERFLVNRLTDIHLHATLDGELGPGGSVSNLTIFTALAIFVLLIACMNYMNLATARATRRAREVGMRKVLGSSRKRLVLQFLCESLLLSLIGFIAALLLVVITLPSFNALAQKELNLTSSPWWLAALLCGMVLLTGFVAGSYPAFALSRFQPVFILGGKARSSIRGDRFMRILVVMQFAISIVLIIGTVTIFHQLRYLQQKGLGFNQEQVVVLRMEDPQMRDNTETVKNELLQNPRILQVAAASNVPGKGLGIYSYKIGGSTEWVNCATYFIDADYLKTLEIHVLEGRGFSRELATDREQAFLVNKSAVARFGWEKAIGKTLNWDGEKQGLVIGVVEDFHFQSLEQKIEPLILHIEPEYDRYLAIRIDPTDIPDTLTFIREKWESLDPNHPFQYSFLDETFGTLFRQVEQFIRIFGYAAALAIFIACLGLFGLAAFAVDRRRKEIGIRKVLGASILRIFRLLSSEIVWLILIAFALASPFAYLTARKILQNFAYRVEIGWWIFALAGGLALIIALLTVSTQAIRAALANPAETLRYE
jgi:putative ABC transport system permease protein